MVEDQMIQVKITASNIKYYKNLGYDIKLGSIIKIPYQCLSNGSHLKIKVICDYCKEEILKDYCNYLNEIKKNIINKDCCKKCHPKKNKEIMLIKYGVENPLQVEEFKNKVIKTNLEKYGVGNSFQREEIKEKIRKHNLIKYGVENILQSEEFKEKVKQTNIERYGVEYYSQTDESKEKIRKTNLEKYGVEYYSQTDEAKEKLTKTNIEKYGVENPFQSEEIKEKIKKHNLIKYGVEYYTQTNEHKEKIKKTNLEKYGYEYGVQSPIIQEKINNSLKKYDNVLTSSQQIAIFETLSNYYTNIFLNYVYSRCILDTALFINDIKIDIEYDGWYWHNKIKDRIRDEFLKSEGWKILRIKSGHKLPSESELLEGILKLINTDRKFTQIILDDWKDKK